jgi:hypothetical protein
MASITSPRYAQMAAHFGNAGIMKNIDSGDVSLSTANLALNDSHKLFQVKKGFCVTGVLLSSTDVDTNGTPTVTMSLGDVGNPARFVAASTIGQTGGVTNTLAATGLGYVFPVDTDIFLRIPAAAATAAAGTVRAVLVGYERTVG